MRSTFLALLGGGVTALAALAFAVTAIAHSEVETVAWDNEANPTQVIATATEDIQRVSGTFYLKVYNAANAQVDLGDSQVTDANRKQMTVSVQPNLPAGAYRVDWATVSDEDGDSADGSLTLALGAQPTSTAAPPATSTAGTVPQTGGPPASGGGIPWAVLALFGAAALVVSGGAVLLSVRREG